MTIDEAIKHAEERAEEQQSKSDKWTKEWDNGFVNYCNKCAEEHRQLAEWLKELKQYREQTDGDLISRQDLLKELKKWDWQDTYLPIHFAELVADLPSAEKTAEWIKSDIPNEQYKCSNCGGACWYYDYQGYIAKSRYCPNCGAKMKESEEEE